MAENQWGSWGDLLGPLKDELQNNLAKNFTNVVKELEKAVSESDELSTLLGLRNENQEKIERNPCNF